MSHLIEFVSIIICATSAAWGSLALLTTQPKNEGEEAIRSRQIDPSTAFCSVFEPCVPFNYPDSIRSKLYVEDSLTGMMSRRGVWALAIVEYNSEAIVESAKVSIISASTNATLIQFDTLMLRELQSYFDQVVAGSKVRKQALGFVGGRPASGTLDDGRMKLDSVVVGNEVVFRGSPAGDTHSSYHSRRSATWGARSTTGFYG